jgi:hypothetical protein
VRFCVLLAVFNIKLITVSEKVEQDQYTLIVDFCEKSGV